MLNDQNILSYFLRSNGNLEPGKTRLDRLEKHLDIVQYLKDRFIDLQDFNVAEILYRIKYNIEEKPKCPICGQPTKFINYTKGYLTYCNYKCANKSELKLEHYKQTCLLKYNCDSHLQDPSIREKIKETCKTIYGVECNLLINEVKNKPKRYNKEAIIETNRKRYNCDYGLLNDEIKEKCKASLIEHYGVDNPWKSEEIRKKIEQTYIEKYNVQYPLQNSNILNSLKLTNVNLYGWPIASQSDIVKLHTIENNLIKYGHIHPNQTPSARKHLSELISSKEVLKKIHDTKKKNKSFNSSKLENLFIDYLEVFFKDDYIYLYRCAEYPFNCDFYIKSLDLYIEILGSWVHGEHPFNVANKDDLVKLNKWIEKSSNSSYFKNAIKVWIETDPKKRKCAEEHNLKYLEIFTKDIQDLIYQFELFILKNKI